MVLNIQLQRIIAGIFDWAERSSMSKARCSVNINGIIIAGLYYMLVIIFLLPMLIPTDHHLIKLCVAAANEQYLTYVFRSSENKQ